MERLQALSQFWAAPILLAFISTVYFVTSPREAGVGERLLVSSHGAVAALVYLAAMAISAGGSSRAWMAWPYLIAQFLPVALIGIAIVRFRGPRIVHVLQPFNLVCMAWAYFVGGMAITGDWL